MPPSSKHEALCEMFRSRPELAAEIVDRSLGISLPRYREALLRSETVTDDRLAELKADAVVEYRQAKRRFAQHYLETLMKLKNYEYQSDFARHYFSEGKAEGRAEGKAQGEVESAAKIILRVLAARGVCVSPEVRARITGCGDLAQLEAWAERAAVVSTTAELFD